MPLTIEQAGALAAQAAALQTAITSLQAGIAARAIITHQSITTTTGVLASSIAFSAEDSATVLNQGLTILQNMLAAVTAELQAMP
jgi:hypothetical protein